MGKVILKMAVFLLLVTLVAAVNNYVINGPLLTHNTELSMRQFNGVVPATAGDIDIGGYWVSSNTLVVVEVIFLSLVAAALFMSHLLNVLVPDKK